MDNLFGNVYLNLRLFLFVLKRKGTGVVDLSSAKDMSSYSTVVRSDGTSLYITRQVALETAPHDVTPRPITVKLKTNMTHWKLLKPEEGKGMLHRAIAHFYVPSQRSRRSHRAKGKICIWWNDIRGKERRFSAVYPLVKSRWKGRDLLTGLCCSSCEDR